MLRGDRPEHWLKSLEPRGPVVWKQVASETGQGGVTEAFSKGEEEESQDRKSEEIGPHHPAFCGKRNLRFSAALPQETSHPCFNRQAPQGPYPPGPLLPLWSAYGHLPHAVGRGSPGIVSLLSTKVWTPLRTGARSPLPLRWLGTQQHQRARAHEHPGQGWAGRVISCFLCLIPLHGPQPRR